MGNRRVVHALLGLGMTFLLCGCGQYQLVLVTPTPSGGSALPPPATAAFTPILPDATATSEETYIGPPTLAPTLTSPPTMAPSNTPAPTLTLSATVELTVTTAPTATLTEAPPTPAPTWTTAPTPTAAVTALPAAERVTFAPGGTSAVLVGNIPAHGTARYVLRAGARQMLLATVQSGQIVRLHIQGANGSVLKDGSGTPTYRGNLPLSQDYFLTLTAGAAAAAYTLQVTIPARISFARGTTADAVQGTLPANSRNYYILGAQAGQLMNVDLSPEVGLKLSIQGLDGSVLLSGMGESNSFRGLLPSTQDYIITVITAGSARNYTLNVQIPERVRFAPGATGAVREGTLAAFQQHAYVLGASAGQELRVHLTAPADAVRMSIWGLDGTVLMSGMGGGDEFEGDLPFTEDYIISLSTGAAGASYSLEVTID